MFMEFTDVIKTRRAIRAFKTEMVPDGLLQKLYEALQAAPTGSNRQPFQFIFVKDKELLKEIVAKACHQDFLYQAPVLMVATCDKGASFDTAIAVDHMVLAATDLGLGTCWVGWFEREPVRAILNIPDTKEIPILIPIGYAAEQPVMRSRKQISEMVVVKN